jgi:hypothetical protein
VWINTNSAANTLSYAPGASGFHLLLHELGHALGLKHPHDNGGTGRPTYDAVGLGSLDIDWASVMSYGDDVDWNHLAWEPATPMLLDVLAMQALYGANNATNAGNSTHHLVGNNEYQSIWDASGNDLVSAAGSSFGWAIQLTEPASTLDLDTSITTPVGFAVGHNTFALSPTLYWLIGDIENAAGSNQNDTLIGNGSANILLGYAGDDTISAQGGNDFLEGGGGRDTLNGGLGVDTAYFSSSQSEYTVLAAPDGRVAVGYDPRGGDGLDVLSGIEQGSFAGSLAGLSPTDSALEYIASYGDLSQALGVNAQAGFDHYLGSGYGEGRAISFNGLEYVASQADLANAFGANGDAGSSHYITNGRFEGRTTSFNGLEYIASYGDLIGAFVANEDKGASHYIASGRFEGRTMSFDGLQYIASYGDLVSAFGGANFKGLGAAEDTGAEHFIGNGFGEGRASVTFDAVQYLANYADLQAAFGSNTQAATVHYVTNGYFEGRTDDLLV